MTTAIFEGDTYAPPFEDRAPVLERPTVKPYQFIGYVPFLKSAGKGQPVKVVGRAQRNAGLSEIGKVLAQASAAPKINAVGIMIQAKERLDALILVAETAKIMYAEVDAALNPKPVEVVEPEAIFDPSALTGRKGKR